jgi:hypothetical protein
MATSEYPFFNLAMPQEFKFLIFSDNAIQESDVEDIFEKLDRNGDKKASLEEFGDSIDLLLKSHFIMDSMDLEYCLALGEDEESFLFNFISEIFLVNYTIPS